MIEAQSVEHQQCHAFLRRSVDERELQPVPATAGASAALLTTQGFEERSVGVLETFANSGIRLRNVIINCYPGEDGRNFKYRDRFETSAKKLAPHRWSVVSNDYEGTWVRSAMESSDADEIILDITGVSNLGLF